MFDTILSVVASFAVLAIVYVLGVLMPLVFWKLPGFRDIRATKQSISSDTLKVAFEKEASKFANYNRNAARISLLIHSSTTEEWINSQVEEISTIFQVMCVLQAIGIFIAILGEGDSSEFHLLIHAPIPELVFLFVMAFLFHRMGRHWWRTKALFRADAW